MKSKINCKRKNVNSNKSINNKRHSCLNLDPNTKISNNIINKEVPSLFKMNKTIQKYVNEKLSLLKETIQPNKTSKGFSRNINNNLHTKKNLSFNKLSKNNSMKMNKRKKGRNERHEYQIFNKEFMTNDNNFKFSDLPKLLNNSKIKVKKNNKKKIGEEINKLIKNNKIDVSTTKGKLVKDFYHNYSSSMSMSTGISLNHNNEIIYNENKIKDNNTINSNNNYEIDSTEEDNFHEIIFKGINQGSPITFGNSFSYTNSKRSSNSKNKENNKDTQEIIDKSVLLLKNQNETLKKELKESNLQITFLKNEIKKLVEKKKISITNYKYNVNIKNKKLDIKPKIFHKNASYIDKYNYDIDKSNYNTDIRNNNIIDYNNYYNNSFYKMKLLKKMKIK